MHFRSVHFYNAAGAPLDGLNVATLLSLYVDREGDPVTPKPVPFAMGGGAYGVLVPDADELAGVVLFFDGGATADTSRYQTRVASAEGMLAWHYLDTAGAPYAGAGTPTISLYNDTTLNPRGAPLLRQLTTYLYATIPTADDMVVGVAMRVDSPGTALPPHYTRTVNLQGTNDYGIPEVVVISPVVGSEIAPTQALVVQVFDNVAMRRTLVVARFDNGDEELVTNGDRFSSRYSNSISSLVTGGKQFSIIRNGGWVQAPTLDVYAIDTSGREA